jgi:hydrogenase maturation protease
VTIVVIGVGNCDRGDDAAGLAVAHRLRAPELNGVVVATSLGDPTDLIDAWSGADLAIVVDALVPSGMPGRVRRFDPLHEPFPEKAFAASTLGLGVAHAVELARALAVLPRRLIVFGIEGGSFAPGCPLGPQVETAIGLVSEAILDELRQTAISARPPVVVTTR